MNNFNYQGNYHTHSQWCNHGQIDAETTIKEAVAIGMTELGFTEHAPFPDNRFVRMSFSALQTYIEDLSVLKEKWKDSICIYIGLEIEYFEKDMDYYHRLLSKCPIDYLLLGQHYFMHPYYDTIIKTKLMNSTEQLLFYCRSISDALYSGFFKILAHPDYCFCCDLPIDDNVKRGIDIIFEAVSNSGTILELNSNGFRKPEIESCIGRRNKYPLSYFWSRSRRFDVRTIIGSDCHFQNTLADDAVKRAFQFAEENGVDIEINNLIDFLEE